MNPSETSMKLAPFHYGALMTTPLSIQLKHTHSHFLKFNPYFDITPIETSVEHRIFHIRCQRQSVIET